MQKTISKTQQIMPLSSNAHDCEANEGAQLRWYAARQPVVVKPPTQNRRGMPSIHMHKK